MLSCRAWSGGHKALTIMQSVKAHFERLVDIAVSFGLFDRSVYPWLRRNICNAAYPAMYKPANLAGALARFTA
jgi:hypothetical protein